MAGETPGIIPDEAVQPAEPKAVAEPAAEDYKGWEKEAADRRDELSTWGEKFDQDWEGISWGTRGRAEPPPLDNYRYRLAEIPAVWVERDGDLADASEPQRAAKDLADEYERLKEQAKAWEKDFWGIAQAEDLRVSAESDRILNEYFEGGRAFQPGELPITLKRNQVREEAQQKFEEWVQTAEGSVYQKYPDLKAYAAKVEALRERKGAEGTKVNELEDAIIQAEMARERAEWRALHGDEPMRHPLDQLRNLLESQRLSEKDDVERKTEYIRRLERRYYLDGPAAVVGRLADVAYGNGRGGLFTPGWER